MEIITLQSSKRTGVTSSVLYTTGQLDINRNMSMPYDRTTFMLDQ